MWLTRLALRYPISTFLFAMTLLVLGLVSLTQLPIDLLPDISLPTITAVSFYTGAGPLDMEQSVTRIIERTVSSVNNVDYVQSSTREGISNVRVTFNWDANLDVGLVDIIQRINRILTILPDGISQPSVLRFDITNLPVCQLVVSGDLDPRDMYDLAYNVIEPQIEHIPGVASATVSGGRIREIHITIDRNRLEALQLPVQSVTQAVAQSNLIVPSGDLRTGTFDYALKTESQFNVVKPMENIVIKTVNGVPVRVKDVAAVEDSYQEETEIIRVNGKSGVTLRVLKLANANTVGVVDNVVKSLPKLSGLPEGVSIQLVFDQAQYIKQSIGNLQHEALFGAILAMLVVLLFLRNARATTIIFVAIPLSIFVTFIFFRFSGTTLNIMTFGGLALAVGRLVDDSIVELEAISRHYNYRRPGETKLQATLAAAKEVASPIFVSTLTTVIVFLPIIFLTGVAKLLFIPLTITIAVALFGSFFVSRTVTPLMCLKYLPPEKEYDPNSRKWTEHLRGRAITLIDSIDDFYQKRLRWALAHRRLVILSILIFAVVSCGLWFFIGTEFFPDQDEAQLTVGLKLPVGTRVEETDKAALFIEKIVRDNVPETIATITDVGVPSTSRAGISMGGNTGSHAGQVRIALTPADQRSRSVFDIARIIRQKTSQIPGVQAYVNPGGFLRFLLNFGSNAPIDVEIRGFDLDAGSSLAQKVFEIVRSTPGATDALISRDDNLPELRVKIDRDKAGALGVNVADISSSIATCINGTAASQYTDPVSGNQYDIVDRLNLIDRSKIEDLLRLQLPTRSGGLVTLGTVASIVRTKSPVQIDRKYQQRIVDVTANVTGRDQGSVAADIQKKIDGLVIPAGFEVKVTGNVEQQSKTFRDLGLAFALAILLVYVVMASQFQSLVDPFIIMFTVPLGIVGVLWILFLTHTTLSVNSFQGVIVMVGIVVSNGILLVDYTNRLRASGTELHEAVMKAGRTRLKPILMTSLATVLGLIPLALGIGGESAQAPLAIAVIGGLTVSTFLTLFLVPTLYTVFEEWFKREIINREETEPVEN